MAVLPEQALSLLFRPVVAMARGVFLGSAVCMVLVCRNDRSTVRTALGQRRPLGCRHCPGSLPL